MTEEELNSVTGNQVEDNTQDYLTAIKELKQNSVNRTEYDKLRDENKKLINAIVNGQPAEISTAKEPKASRADLIKALNKPGITDLDYAKASLELRDLELAETGRDMYCPLGVQYVPTDEDKASAERVAEELRDMINIADGDSNVFKNEYMRRGQDVNLPRKH